MKTQMVWTPEMLARVQRVAPATEETMLAKGAANVEHVCLLKARRKGQRPDGLGDE
jgi:hypothetical protein